MKNGWQQKLDVGTRGEEEVVAHINHIRPEWKLERIAGAYELDAQSIHGGWEIKTYDDWYRNPLIEVSCLSGIGDTMWLKDERIKIICLNHWGWLHIYNAEKMRAEWNKGTFEKHAYDKWVEQGQGDNKKQMLFFSIKDTSTLQKHWCSWEEDPLRWNMLDTFGDSKDNPYMVSIPMQKRIAPQPNKINMKLLRTVFNQLQLTT
jgi:hypothetical protein